MKTYVFFNDHICPVCKHKIGEHVNSPFAQNPKTDAPTGEIPMECPRSYNSLIIEKLTSAWNDAMSERDAYIKSYGEACKDRDYYMNALKEATQMIKEFNENWTRKLEKNRKIK